MENRVFLNNGKSSKMKTPTLPNDYASFKSAMEAGTQFVDIQPNDSLSTDAGVSVIGTALNTANLLSNNTAAALGLTSAATPNDAFAEIANSLEVINTIQFVVGDWVVEGTGWKQVITVNGITTNSKPIPSLHYSTPLVEATCKSESKAYGNIRKFETGAGTITAYASAKPSVAFYVDMRGV